MKSIVRQQVQPVRNDEIARVLNQKIELLTQSDFEVLQIVRCDQRFPDSGIPDIDDDGEDLFKLDLMFLVEPVRRSGVVKA